MDRRPRATASASSAGSVTLDMDEEPQVSLQGRGGVTDDVAIDPSVSHAAPAAPAAAAPSSAASVSPASKEVREEVGRFLDAATKTTEKFDLRSAFYCEDASPHTKRRMDAQEVDERHRSNNFPHVRHQYSPHMALTPHSNKRRHHHKRGSHETDMEQVQEEEDEEKVAAEAPALEDDSASLERASEKRSRTGSMTPTGSLRSLPSTEPGSPAHGPPLAGFTIGSEDEDVLSQVSSSLTLARADSDPHERVLGASAGAGPGAERVPGYPIVVGGGAGGGVRPKDDMYRQLSEDGGPTQSASASQIQTVVSTQAVPRVTFHVGIADSHEDQLDALDEDQGPRRESVSGPDRAAGKSDKESGKKRPHHHHHHHHHVVSQKDLQLRRQLGSEIQLKGFFKPSPPDQEEPLAEVDRQDISTHRYLDAHGMRKRKAARSTMGDKKGKGRAGADPAKAKVTYDHSPHEMFVELDELYLGPDQEWTWQEKARWIKFEEDVEEGAGRWGKPHVASLSFHSLLELRKCLAQGAVLLDLDVPDLGAMATRIVDELVATDQLNQETRGMVLKALLLKHKHVAERRNFMRRNLTYMNLMGLDASPDVKHRFSLRRSSSIPKSAKIASPDATSLKPAMPEGDHVVSPFDFHSDFDGHVVPTTDVKAANHDHLKIQVDEPWTASSGPPSAASNGTAAAGDFSDVPAVSYKKQQSPTPSRKASRADAQECNILKRIPEGSEATAVLVGSVDYLPKPIMAFVRLAEGRDLGQLTEVPLPVRFVFVLMGPSTAGIDYHEIGRSISTLMANTMFHDVAYQADDRGDLLDAINEFLDQSIVLPPGDWDKKTLLPIMDMARRKALARRKKKELKEKTVTDEEEDPFGDPLKRTKRLFGGLVNDVRRRYPKYLSDFKDALNVQCLATFFFIYFACLSPAITFGGLLGEQTNRWMGVQEMLVVVSASGFLFALFSGQPLLIIGATGPLLIFEAALYQICESVQLDFMAFRCWIGVWVTIISIVVVMFEGSFLVRLFTRFTEEIFASLISLIFIIEVFVKLSSVFERHPLMPYYIPDGWTCHDGSIYSSNDTNNVTSPAVLYTTVMATTLPPSDNASNVTSSDRAEEELFARVSGQPNTSLLSLILTFGTFLIAYFLKHFRNSKFLGRNARRALGDFGIPIAILIMVLIDWGIKDTYTEKLDVPDGLSPTAPERRGWFINPLGVERPLPEWTILVAVVPAILLFILIFMESMISSMIVNKKDRHLKKGSGYHLDLFIIGLFGTVSGFIGLPFLCAATVRSVSHVSSLSVYSRTHAPGDKPKLVEVKEQRLTAVAVHIMIGISVMMGPVLRLVPLAVLFGVFLYMGIASMSGIQLFERTALLLMPVKHHPDVGYVRRVKTSKMHLYTFVQLVALGALWAIKSTQAALAFPFLLILLVPVRKKLLPFMFTEKELHELDKDEADASEAEEEPDFYEQAHMPW